MGTLVRQIRRALLGRPSARLLLLVLHGMSLFPLRAQADPVAQLASAGLGGGTVIASSAGGHLLSATAGQAAATSASAGGQSLSSGFWPVVLGASPAEGAVTCRILPGAALDRGAKWRLTAGPDTSWQISGATLSGLPVAGNPYTVTFRSLAGWTSPADQSVTVVGGETTAVQGTYALRTYALVYLAGPNGSIAGPSPQTVDHGGTGAEVSALPATGYHFERWSDASTDNPRRDTGVTADLTVTAEFAANVYSLTFLADAGGSIMGSAVQAVAHGGNATPVTAVPPYLSVFQQWSDGSDTNPRTLTNVTASQTLTARFRAAMTADPDGPFLAMVRRDAVATRGLWDLTGAYGIAVGGGTLAMDLVHDTKGKISGTALYTPAKALPAHLHIKGAGKGAGGALAVKLSLKGASPDQSTRVALTLDLALNASTGQLDGTLAGSVTTDATTASVSGPIGLAVPTPMDGTWSLALALTQGTKGVTGAARLTLSNGSDYDFTVKGKPSGQAVALSLAAAPADPAAKGIKIKTTITPLEGGWARIEAFSGKGYGQALAW